MIQELKTITHATAQVDEDQTFIRRRITFLEGQIVTDSGTGEASNQNGSRYRILYLPQSKDDDKDEGYWIDTTGTSNIPESFSLSELTEKVLLGECSMATDLTEYPEEKEISKASKEVRDRSFLAIRDIVEQEPAIYRRNERGALIKHAMDVSGLSYVSIYNCLGRYWRGGKELNALLPNYKVCGTKRSADFVQSKKLGRKKKYEGTNGKILTADDIRNFEYARDDYLSKKNGTLQSSYTRMLTYKYSHEDSEHPGKFLQLKPEEKPSFRQFYYWYTKNRNASEDVRKKKGEHETNLKHRAILGRSETGIIGPGMIAQIDATIGDFYLVRGSYREQIVGRPVLFFVMDVKTRMIIGMHITLENASWESALIALKNCADNKVEYCKQYEISIRQDEWPCNFMPSSIVADNGELSGKGVETVIRKLGITVENMPPYRGDLKGIIERNFERFHMRFRDIAPGYVDKDQGIRGSDDNRLKACLTVREFTQMVIRCVLFYNNTHLMKQYNRSISMIDRGIMAVPLQLWNYGIRYETGALRTLSRDTILQVLLPRDTASVTACGIRFNEIYYTCPEAEQNLWFEKARTEGSWKIEVAYDPTSAKHIYMFGENDRIITCRVLEKDLEYGELSEEELSRYNETNRQDIASYSQQEEQGESELERQLKLLTDRARKDGETAGTIKKTLARCSVADSRNQEKSELNGSAEYLKNQSGEDLQKLARERELHRHRNDAISLNSGKESGDSIDESSGKQPDEKSNEKSIEKKLSPVSSDDVVGKRIEETLRNLGMI